MAGVGFGYSNHQTQLRRALIAKGVEMTEASNIAVTITPAGNFEPSPGKFNVLYTMYEAVTLPKDWIPKLKDADLIVVPCKHNEQLFRKYYDGPIEICWEGVDVDSYKYIKRSFPVKPHPFVFLWVGASNARKGTEFIAVAWSRWQRQYPKLRNKAQLVMKTTQLAAKERFYMWDKEGNPMYKPMPAERIVSVDGNACIDTRRLPVKPENGLPGMVDLYHYAHAFLMPSLGEGFGLTLAEAMATGLPCIYTPWSGPVEFISSKEGYPIKFGMGRIKATRPQEDGTWKVDHESFAAEPDVKSIVQRMLQIYSDYDTALKKGHLAMERIHRDITWPKSADSFISIIEKYTKERLAA